MSSAPLTTSARDGRAGSAGLPRLLAAARDDGRTTSFRGHLDHYGPARDALCGHELLAELDRSGLTGRGGASFPVAEKLRAVSGGRRHPVVLVNGAEGEPTSAKDRALLSAVPHLVLDGAVLSAEAVGAGVIYIAVCRTATVALATLEAAVAERRRHEGYRPAAVRIVPVPSGFVVGEETALVRFLNGGPAKPTFTPPRPFERGVGRAPTLVHNVETLAQIALIARFGAEWFRELGTSDEPGSTLVTVSGAVRRRGVHEIAHGTSFPSLVEEAGGARAPLSAFLVGGYFGSWVSADTARSLRLLDADLAGHGAALGARSIVAMPADVCALADVARVVRYLAAQSAGQCGPCVNGLAAIAAGFDRIVAGTADDRPRLECWVEMVRGRGACKHPDGAASFVASALKVFTREVETHLQYGRCRAAVAGVLPVPEKKRV